MCGLAGFAGPVRWSDSVAVLTRMTDAIVHRGPDDAGLWLGAEGRVGLGHRRLSILDLSPQGHQPMVSASGRYRMAYNGEVYNFAALRAELEHAAPRSWRGHSDTEIMLAAFEQWGVADALRRFNGMFALALWDERERTLVLARDIAGEKPLYVGWHGATLLFGSELKSLRAVPGFAPAVNRDALAMFLRHNYIGAPHCIYEGVQKLRPGTLRRYRVDEEGCRELGEETYWSAAEVFATGAANRLGCDPVEATDRLDALLGEAVRLRMVADVPVGAFLSGGIDSSTIVALMQRYGSMRARTFSIGFTDPAYDESAHARAVAAHLGTEHTEFIVTPQQARDVIPRLPLIYDEPFADSSQIPTFLVSELARRHVTVALTGDAGDELFAGYQRYFLAHALVERTRRIPSTLRRAAAGLLESWPAALQPLLRLPLERALGHAVSPVELPDKLRRLAQLLRWRDPEEIYLQIVSHWMEPSRVALGGTEPATLLRGDTAANPLRHPVERFQYADFMTYLPDDILVKVDRAGMAVSLEGRIPLLDPNVIAFAASLPYDLRVRAGQGKWLLRQVLYRYVPRDLVERPKTGFGIPLAQWLVGPLRDWVEHLLDDRRLRDEGYFDADLVRDAWAAQQSGERQSPYHLWDILMFQAWLDAEKGRA